MAPRWKTKLRRAWNWLRGKRIVFTDPARGRVMVRTGHNSANRNTGGQWYILRYETANGTPPLPRCSRGRLDRPKAPLRVERFAGERLACAERWYEARHGALREGQALELVCVFDPPTDDSDARLMRYRPNEVFETEYAWLSEEYSGPRFTSYFGSWYGSGTLDEDAIMDFEIFWDVGESTLPLPRWGVAWR